MAKRVFIYGLKLAFQTVAKYVKRYESQIIANGGQGLYSVVEFAIALALVVIAAIDGGENAEGDWLAPLDTLSSANISQVNAAIAKWQSLHPMAEG